MNSESWGDRDLGAIAKIQGGKRLPKGVSLLESKNAHPYIRVSDMGNRYIDSSKLLYVPDEVFPLISRYIVQEGDIILSIVGTIGLVTKITPDLDKASLTENCVKITNLDGVISDYLYYYLTSGNCQNEIKSKTVGTTQPKLPIYNIMSLHIPVPPLSTQQRIADILNSLDEKIELNRQTNTTLEAIAQAIFKEWFVDFNYPGATGEQVDSELGPIPKGWSVDNLGGFATLSSGKGLKRTEFTDEGYPVLGANGQIGFTNHYLLDDEVILTGRVGTLGTLQLINKKVWISDNVLVITPKEECYYHYLFFWLKTIDFQNLNRGSTQPLITKTDLLRLSISQPDVNILIEYDRICRGLFTLLENNSNESGLLSEIRDHLLPKLMSGEIEL